MPPPPPPRIPPPPPPNDRPDLPPDPSNAERRPPPAPPNDRPGMPPAPWNAEPPPPMEGRPTPSRDAGVDRANDGLPANPRPALVPELKPRCTPWKPRPPADVRAKLLAFPPRNDDVELPRNASELP